MTINAVGYSPVNYSQTKKAPAKQNVSFAGSETSNAEKGKKFGKAFASFFVTGLGQMFDGRFKDGIKDLALAIGLGAAAKLSASAGLAAKSKAGQILGAAGAVGLAIAWCANAIHSVVDAYKGGK